MTTWAVVATGESLGPEPAAVVSKVKHLPCVAVGNAYELMPWARALVACDKAWWSKHQTARLFRGEKWCANVNSCEIPRMRGSGIYTNTNSGLLGLHYAVGHGATRVLLLGIDMKGTHYFGEYKNGCVNTVPERFSLFIRQFGDFAKTHPDVEVINCSVGSALECFPKMALDEAVRELEAA